jgi:hypothetical protein
MGIGSLFILWDTLRHAWDHILKTGTTKKEESQQVPSTAPTFALEQLMKDKNILIRIGGVPTEIRTQRLPNIVELNDYTSHMAV